MYEGQKDAQDIPYQIVFAATKESREDWAKQQKDKEAEAEAEAKAGKE